MLLTVGRRFDAAELGPLPKNVHVEAWIAQAEILDHVALVVCHGGSGTVFGALAAGVPMVIVPLFADQFENARRIADARAGLVIDRKPQTAATPRGMLGRRDATRIAQGIETLLGDRSYRREARRIADQISGTPTVDAVLATLLTTT
jgi:UDP:flavonoid glycosyltransferase YjiC (YdhE family)